MVMVMAMAMTVEARRGERRFVSRVSLVAGSGLGSALRALPHPGGLASVLAMTTAVLLSGTRITSQAPMRRLVSFIRAHCPAEESDCRVVPSFRR
jgi:hypothetical protein